jgi:hypothetical protein
MTFAGAVDTSTGIQVRIKLAQLGGRQYERFKFCGRNPKMMTRWPPAITVTRDNTGKTPDQNLRGK